MDFPISALMDEQACYDKLVTLLHPYGLCCPRCGSANSYRVHSRERAPVLRYRCRPNATPPGCGRVFNAFTDTVLNATDKRPATIVLLLRGFAQGVPTAKLARELTLGRQALHEFRKRVQQQALLAFPTDPLSDPITETDEMFQNAGEKRHSTSPPRRPAPSPRQQSPRPRHLGKRSSARVRDGRPRLGTLSPPRR